MLTQDNEDLTSVSLPVVQSTPPPAAAPAAAPAASEASPASPPAEPASFSPPPRAAAAEEAAAPVTQEAQAPAGVDGECGDEEEFLPDPTPEPQGLIGIGAKMLQSKASELAESEKLKKSVEYLKDKSKVVTENEKVQQSVEYLKTKTTEIVESERVQKGMEYASKAKEVAATKAVEVGTKVTEKTKEGIEFAKEKTNRLREGAGSVWESGRGSIQRVKSNVSSIAWRGSARDTLDMAAREEQWKGIKVQGAEELCVPARTEHTCCYHVSKGSTLRWTFRVKEHDIGFGVRMRVQEWGGSREDEVLAVERYDSSDTISGSWVADEDRTMVLVFDNRYSKLRSKTVAYLTGTEKPPVFVETPAATESASSPSEPCAAPVASTPEEVKVTTPATPADGSTASSPAAAQEARPIV